MVKIAIDAGHGFNTPGKRTPDGEREWMFNDIVARYVIAGLRGYEDVETLRLDDHTGIKDVSLVARTNKANAWKADVLVSIHHNADEGKWGNHTGTETYIYPGSEDSRKLAEVVHPQLVKHLRLKDRGIKEAKFHMLSESNMPAILTEGGFMDSNIDIIALRDETRLKAQADGIVRGLVSYFGLKKSGEVKGVAKKDDNVLPNTEFSSPTVRKAFEKLLESKATQQIVIDGGIKAGAFGANWKTRWEKRELAPMDIVGLAVLKALKE